MTKTEIQKALVELQIKTLDLEKQLDKCPDDVESFTCKGKWFKDSPRPACEGNGESINLIKAFNYWQTREITEKAYALQLVHRKMLSFVSQHQELGVGNWYLFQNTKHKWAIGDALSHYPDRVTMTKETANIMLKAIENGSLDLS